MTEFDRPEMVLWGRKDISYSLTFLFLCVCICIIISSSSSGNSSGSSSSSSNSVCVCVGSRARALSEWLNLEFMNVACCFRYTDKDQYRYDFLYQFAA